jgi:transmembrane sensor
MLALAEKWLAGTITPEEKTRLFEWYDRFDDTELTLEEDQAAAFSRLKQEMLRDIRQRIKPAARIRHLGRLSVAAAVLLLFATAGWLATQTRTTPQLAQTTPGKNALKVNDIGPGSDKAILTLADGSTVTLDSAGTGSLGRQGNARVIKSGDGQLQYASNNDETTAKAMVYNILSTPRGGQYRLKLQDGTNVWLNAGSSIRYPTAFLGKERKVEITGEAYFEIAKNADMPFRVSVTDPAAGEKATEIEVLGTGFDVNAYKDEADLKTTLIEGAIKVTSGPAAVTLKPSQQVIVSSTKAIQTVSLENTEQIIAWKNGSFDFDDADIPTIMRQIARWYDVDVEYEGKGPADHFSGTFPRNTSLAGVLQILHTSGVRLVAENKKIVIRS